MIVTEPKSAWLVPCAFFVRRSLSFDQNTKGFNWIAFEKTNFTAEDVGKLQYEIDKIGNNINQIAVRANGSSNIDEIEFFKLRDNYMELLSAFYDFIHGKGDVN